MKENEVRPVNAQDPLLSEPAIQLICLGSGGGPSEDNVTGLLVRSTASNWSKGSLLAVDAGSHLAAIIRILEKSFPRNSEDNTKSLENGKSGSKQHSRALEAETASFRPLENVTNLLPPKRPSMSHASATTLSSGPFTGLTLPHETARANAGLIVREHVATYLITHPHLDHLAGFAINTAAFHNTSRPKRLAALPGTVDAIKRHIFNDVIWPNLTDEDGGVGFVTFQRLAEGGNIALGAGEGRGYIEVCDGLSVRGMKVSHGHCTKNPNDMPAMQRGSFSAPSISTANNDPGATSTNMPAQHAGFVTGGLNGISNTPVGRPREDGRRSMSISAVSQPGTPAQAGGAEEYVVDSTAFFIRTTTAAAAPCLVDPASPSCAIFGAAAAKEILVFGDVEPDSLSLHPRTARVWAEAAPKVAHGVLKAVCIECSYDDTQDDAVLFGHLAPRHLVQELATLADMVRTYRAEEAAAAGMAANMPAVAAVATAGAGGGSASGPTTRGQIAAAATRKRKRLSTELTGFSPTARVGFETPTTSATTSPGAGVGRTRSRSRGGTTTAAARALSRRKSREDVGKEREGGDYFCPAPHTEDARIEEIAPPLAGLTVVVIHVKDTLRDGPLVGENILRQLKEHAARLADEGQPLGCEFVISKSGASYSF
ncbi:MAG: 3',5'-cyclic-nucleotide phosphodiesterase pde1 [Bathelium mastoideum]|nr:MAG: 3',5'-cyclic-nucleotide phosphodiesterase pde1 [Bathelium mastoideum]